MAQENNYQRMDSPSPSTEGPQFDLDEKEGWLSKYGTSIILPIVAILILAGGIYLYATQKEETTLSLEEESDILDQELVDLNQEESEDVINLDEEDATATETQEATEEETIKEIVPETRRLDNVIIAKAGKGDGITNLARQALSDYLKTQPQENLSNEHRVYIEDYIQNKTGSQGLEVGEEISFSEGLIEEAINNSLQLNETQLKKLEEYSALVDWQN